MRRWVGLWTAVFGGLCWAHSAQAQVNTEKYRPAEDGDGVGGGLTVGVGFQKGNVDLIDVGVEGGASWNRGDDHLFAVTSGRIAAKRTLSDYAESPDIDLMDEDARYSNKMLAHLRYNRDLKERLTWEVFGQVQKDSFILLSQRLLGGTGPRFALADGTDGPSFLGVAYMAEYERLDEESIAHAEPVCGTAHRLSAYLNASVHLTDALALSGTTYFQPRFDQFADFRLLGEGSLDVSVAKSVTLGVGLKLRHDSAPPAVASGTEPLAPTDIEVKNKLTISF